MTVSEFELIDWLFIRHAPALGDNRLQSLLQQFGDAGAIRAAGRSELQASGLSNATIDFLRQAELPAAIEQELRWTEDDHHHIIVLSSAEYPDPLKNIPNPPPLLYARGNAGLLKEPQLAIVGSRKPTRGGLDNARDFSHHFSRAGLVITSGLARGIDGAAHEGALIDKGPTLAVMATGADRLYPPQHKNLAREILENNGLLVTEMPLGTQPLPELFPQRNRIISGLSCGVLVVEAAKRSGSLITARQALEQGREVFAIPGSIHNTQARGCHQLIKQGAKLIESADDILEELVPVLRGKLADTPSETVAAAGSQTPLDGDYQRLLKAMGHDAVSIDQLVERCGISARDVSSMLLILELNGHIQTEAGGLFSRKYE